MASNDPSHNQHTHPNSGSRPFIGLQSPPPDIEYGFDRVHERSRKGQSFSLGREIGELFRDPVRQAFYAAIWYGLGGIFGQARINEAAGIPEATFGSTLYILVGFGLPALLMVWRRGLVSAGIVCGLTLINTITTFNGMNAGLPGYTIFAVLTHVFFLSIFARGFATLWSERKR